MLWLIPLLPLLGFLIASSAARCARSASRSSAPGVVGCSRSRSRWRRCCTLAGAADGARARAIASTRWIAAGPLHVDVAFRVDALSAVMMLIVTGVGFLIHVYSVGYMHDDPSFARFFAYLNLFISAMLILVLGRQPARCCSSAGRASGSAPTC